MCLSVCVCLYVLRVSLCSLCVCVCVLAGELQPVNIAHAPCNVLESCFVHLVCVHSTRCRDPSLDFWLCLRSHCWVLHRASRAVGVRHIAPTGWAWRAEGPLAHSVHSCWQLPVGRCSSEGSSQGQFPQRGGLGSFPSAFLFSRDNSPQNWG